MYRLSLLQRIFLTQEWNQGLLHCRRFFTNWATREAQFYVYTSAIGKVEIMGARKLLCKMCLSSSTVNIVLRILHACLKFMSLWGLFSLTAVLGQFQKSPWAPEKAVEVNSATRVRAWLHCLSLPRACLTRGHNHIAACSESKGYASEKSAEKSITASVLLWCLLWDLLERVSNIPQVSERWGRRDRGIWQVHLISSFQRKRKMLLLPPPTAKGSQGTNEVTPSCQNLEPRMRDSY